MFYFSIHPVKQIWLINNICTAIYHSILFPVVLFPHLTTIFLHFYDRITLLMSSVLINCVLLLGCSSRKGCFFYWQRRFKKFLGPMQNKFVGITYTFSWTENADRAYVNNTLDKKSAKQPILKGAS
jgi:hypothetical protein